jgi:hypothetical protein
MALGTSTAVAGVIGLADTGAALAAAALAASGDASPVTVADTPLAVSPHLAAGLFTALAHGTVDTAELTVVGGGADLAVCQALAARMSAAGSAQANLECLLWGSGDSSWLDGKREWLP